MYENIQQIAPENLEKFVEELKNGEIYLKVQDGVIVSFQYTKILIRKADRYTEGD